MMMSGGWDLEGGDYGQFVSTLLTFA